MFEEISENTPDDLERILSDVIDAISILLESRQMYDPQNSLVAGLQSLLSIKCVPKIVRSRPSFFGNVSKAKDHSQQSVKVDDAWALQHSSLIGHLLRPTPIDENMFPEVCENVSISIDVWIDVPVNVPIGVLSVPNDGLLDISFGIS